MIIAIDPGIVNLGFIAGTLGADDIQIDTIDNVDLTTFPGDHLPDKISAFVESRRELFTAARKIIIEKQPPQSAALAVEAVLYMIFKSNGWSVRFVHPTSTASFFGTLGMEYNLRKRENIKRAYGYIKDLQLPEGRLHDICDAVCLLIYIKEHPERKEPPCIQSFRYNNFKQFEYKKKSSP